MSKFQQSFSFSQDYGTALLKVVVNRGLNMLLSLSSAVVFEKKKKIVQGSFTKDMIIGIFEGPLKCEFPCITGR